MGNWSGGCHAASAPHWLQQWASPRRLLALLCAINLLFFLDRGVVASNGVNGSAGDPGSDPGISATFGLSLFEDGLVAALYYVGVMLGAPVFAQLSKRRNVLRLIGAGGALFAAAALLCGFSQSFAMVLVFRCLVGAGTGSLIALGPPLIDDHAPPASKALWLGIFYLCMPTGVAVGYLFGGAVGSGLTWRAAFWIEAGLAVPLALWCLLAPAVDIRRHLQGPAAELAAAEGAELAQLPAGPPSQGASPALEAQLAECRRPSGLGAAAEGELAAGKELLGSAAADQGSKDSSEGELEAAVVEEAATLAPSSRSQPANGQQDGDGGQPAGGRGGALGAVGTLFARLWAAAVAFCQDLRQLAAHPVALCVIAGLTAWNGFIGAYGYYGPKAVRDLFGLSPDDADFIFGAVLAATGIVGSLAGGILLDLLGSTLPRGMLLGAAGLGGGCVFVVVAVTAARSQAAFWPLFALGEASVFLVQAPANACCMWAVPAGLRPFALSISEALQHLLGDIPTPPALGALQGAVDSWRLSLAAFALLLLLGSAAFLVGAMVARGARDYRREEQLLLASATSSRPQGQEQQLLLPAAAGAQEGRPGGMSEGEPVPERLEPGRSSVHNSDSLQQRPAGSSMFSGMHGWERPFGTGPGCRAADVSDL